MASECCLLYLFSQWKYQHQSQVTLMKVGVPVNNSRVGNASCIQLASTPKLHDTKLQIHQRMWCVCNLVSRRQGRSKNLVVGESVVSSLLITFTVFAHFSSAFRVQLFISPYCIMQKIFSKPNWLLLGAEITPLMPKFQHGCKCRTRPRWGQEWV